MSNWQLTGKGKHFNYLAQKTEGEQKLRAKHNKDMQSSRRSNEYISPAIKEASLEDWLS